MSDLSRISADDRVGALAVLGEIKTSASDVLTQIKQLRKKHKMGELDMSKGISFLDVKNHQMLSYLINLTHLMLQKCQGKSIKDSPDVERLVEIRTSCSLLMQSDFVTGIRKMRPTEQKLKYQIDKLVRIGSGVDNAANDPLRLKPNPRKLISKLDNDDEDDDSDKESADSGSEEEKQEQKSSSSVYKPAKLVPMFYDGDVTARQKQDRQNDQMKKRMARSSVMVDLYKQYIDAPEEIVDAGGRHRGRENKVERERREYEENYFVRKSLTKKERHQARQMRTVAGLNDLTSFPDFSLFGGAKNTKLPGSRKRPAGAMSSSKSKGGKKFRK